MTDPTLTSPRPSFVHLHVHSEYSLKDSTIKLKSLMPQVAAMGMPAMAMTDINNLFGMVKFYSAARQAGIKPIIGMDVRYWDDEDQREYRIVLLCESLEGYKNLSKLISMAYQQGQDAMGHVQVQYEWFKQFAEGLIVLSGGLGSDVANAIVNGEMSDAKARLQAWQDIYGDNYTLELSRCGHENEEAYIYGAVQLAAENGVPLVATNDVVFIKEEDFGAHEARVCIHDGYVLGDKNRPKKYTPQQYLRSPEEMTALFSDIPQAIANTVSIAMRCNVEVQLGDNYLPQFPIPEGMTEADYLAKISEEGLEERLLQLFETDDPEYSSKRDEYFERLRIEIDVINSMGFPGYFLIVADFIQWAKDNDIPVGPGRGSGAGSIVAYALKITDLDPIRYALLFERFLNPERVSMPDFDIDFCMDNRDKVIDYVARQYGREKVSQIITFGTMAAKAVVRDVGRVLDQPYGFVDKISKMIPFELKMTLEKALKEAEDLKELYDTDDDGREIIDMAMQLEGLVRNVGKHAGGVLISPSDLVDFTPIYCEPDGTNVVSQYDKDDVESVGLVKFDFLGLRNLTIIDWAVKSVAELTGEQIDLINLPLDDKLSFDVLLSANTTAIFQLESQGMKDLIKRLKPDCFEDIIALVALYRPGPLQSGMTDDFVARKNGLAMVTYPHPDLEEILSETYGVIVYQEQVMQIAQILANYSLGGADMLRRAMGKKKAEEMAEQRQIFLKGAEERQVDARVATDIFDSMEKFAEYGFNKSHSAAYALVSYQTLWLKAHHPAHFMAAVLSADMDNTEKVVTMVDECAQLGLTLLPPDINASQYMFTAVDEQTVLFGLGAIKGVGESVLNLIIEAREENGYESMQDMLTRIDSTKLNNKALQTLINAGCFDGLEYNRRTLSLQLDDVIALARKIREDKNSGQGDLFGAVQVMSDNNVLKAYEEYASADKLSREKSALGLYLTGHPINDFKKELRQFTDMTLRELNEKQPGEIRGKQGVVIAGIVSAISTRNSDRGKWGFVTLDDKTGKYECLAFSDVWSEQSERVKMDELCVVFGSLSVDKNDTIRLRVAELIGFDEARERLATSIKVRLRPDNSRQFAAFLQQAEMDSEHGVAVNCYYENQTAKANIRLGQSHLLRLGNGNMEKLAQAVGREHIHIVY